MNDASLLMKTAEFFGLNSLAWSARRLHCPVSSEALVLDVGSGGNPYPRANVLLDAYEDTVERFHQPLIKDRPIVFGIAEQMPFKDKAFDFVIASHILEHTSEPEKFIMELMRVGKAGYIETPDGFFERINPFRFHRLEVSLRSGCLLIYKKPSWRHESELVDLYENQLKCREFIKFTSKAPKPFYVRYYWEDEINYRVVNPDINADWPLPNSEFVRSKISIRNHFVALIRRFFSQAKRNASLDLSEILICPSCRSNQLIFLESQIKCESCAALYLRKNGIPIMYPSTKNNSNSNLSMISESTA